jgi:EAL domain-containing protein (putative c-di-GMP-specific phosphodiesterase class I)
VLHADRLERATLQSELATAVAAGQLELHYQPVTDAATGAWVGAEALVRWQHPELGRLSPARFIPLAEESDLIVAIGEWVLQAATRQLAAWRAAHLVSETFTVAVNVSGTQLTRDDLLEHVERALAESGVPAPNLVLEVTETAVIDPGAVLPRLVRLKQTGVRLAIDDFGTGHSSLSYLKHLPADIVKLPRPFVRDAGHCPKSAAIVEGLVRLAAPLGMTVLAEGVETPEQQACVTRAGCVHIQGFLHAPPLPADAFATCLVGRATPVC